jgi:hypothetical protein
MAKRETKGQQVKTFTTHEPQEDMGHVPVSVKVYFKDDQFWAYLPEHMRQVVENLPLFREGRHTKSSFMQIRLSNSGDSISGKIVDHVVDGYKQVLLQYFQHLTDLTARKVIKVTFAANLPYSHERHAAGKQHAPARGGGHWVTASDISFVGSPAVHLNYEILWRAGDVLYRKVGGHLMEPRMQYVENPFLHVKSPEARQKIENRLLEWTAEKEEFLRQTVERLTTLGYLMLDFFGDTEANLQYALTNGGQLALPPSTAPQS